MPRKKKPITDLPTDQAMRKLFPKKVVDKAKEVAHERDGDDGGNNRKTGKKPRKSK